jgi:hypothetical protein
MNGGTNTVSISSTSAAMKITAKLTSLDFRVCRFKLRLAEMVNVPVHQCIEKKPKPETH